MSAPKKVAIACDWLTNVGGAEKVLLEIHRLFPEAPIYTSKYDKKGIDWFNDADIRTGWMQIFPTSWRRLVGPLRQIYFNHLNLDEYDLIISVTGAEAKSIKAGKGKTHICYCHAPTQYYYGKYDAYIENPGFGFFNPIIRFFFKLLVNPLRKADEKAAQNPDSYIAISEHSRAEIKKYYHRDATVINPPVENSIFNREKSDKRPVENFYITTSRQVNWKRLDLAIKACIKLDRNLLVIGEGPEHDNLKKLATGHQNIKFLPLMSKNELKDYLSVAKAYLFPSEEPFGIAPVEAMAAGCPVIAYKEGGAADYVLPGKNGLFFEKQTVSSLAEQIELFEKLENDPKKRLNRQEIPKTVEKFSTARFDKEIMDFVSEKIT